MRHVRSKLFELTRLSGDRTRLAWWFRRLAETNFSSGRSIREKKKCAMARAPSPTREARMLPGLEVSGAVPISSSTCVSIINIRDLQSYAC